MMKGYQMGETLAVIIAEQMKRARQGDRFWHEREFCKDELQLIKKVTLSVVI
jgi:hypothetical protein